MLKITSPQTDKEFSLEEKEGVLSINGKIQHSDLIKISENKFHLINNHRSYTLEVLKEDREKKEFTIKVNGTEYQLKAEDKYDALLKKMGLSRGVSAKVNELKAPMPGLVLNIKVQIGQEVKKDEPLLILEAMKMENVLKSPADVVVKSIEVNEKAAVEKNQVLIKFE
ncbi:MAG: biotin/lipoyl-containing protein [Bacteroidia bacterium]